MSIKPTGKYPCQWDDLIGPNKEDRIINYAERLMKPLTKYGNPEESYDFSRARTSRQKAEVVSI